MEAVTDLIFLGSKIPADGDCSHKIKRCLLPGKKAMTNLDSVLKSRDITLPREVCLVKAMVLPAVIYRCENWTIRKVDHQRIDGFWTVVLEKTVQSPLDSKDIKPCNPKGNQPWILIRRTDTEAMITWYEEPTHWKRSWFQERLKAKEGGKQNEMVR